MKNPFNSLSLSGLFLTQLLFGLFLSLVFGITLHNVPLSIFLGVIGGMLIGWFTAATTTGPQAQPVATSEGIDAGLKYWLFLLLGFTVLGFQPSMSIFLSAIGGLGAGWILAWWKTKEESRTQLPQEVLEDLEADEATEMVTTRRRRRKQPRRYRRVRGIDFIFWRRD
jgi:hypothetical protein